VLLTLAALATIIVLVGRWLAPVARRSFERVAGLLLIGTWLAGLTFDLINPRASASTTLPLHWCDVCGVLAIFVMFKPQYRVARAVLHFWALCLCSLAFILPVIGLGPAFIDFWIYFGTHAAILLMVAYDRGVRGFEPSGRDLAWAAGLCAAWVVLLQPVNLALGANNGFVGADDRQVRKAIRSFGPWPWRIAPLLIIEVALMCGVLLAQQLAGRVVARLTRREQEHAPLPFPVAAPERSTPERSLQRAA
jgi:hypothetical integral membrane protein (TIGR02206 family)